MSTQFSSLPIIDLSPLHHNSPSSLPSLSQRLHDVFSTTGFAYLINAPLSFSPDEILALAHEFFSLPEGEKQKLAKKSFRPENTNTYRGYFPTQPNLATDNLKEGFEVGPPNSIRISPEEQPEPSSTHQINLSEPNVWPPSQIYPSRPLLEKLHTELQSLSSSLLSLLAISLNQKPDFFTPYLENSISTLRLLHYPPTANSPSGSENEPPRLSCTPHTDSGLLTLLHQDPTGGLEVQDSTRKWVPAPYIPDSMVVNIGDLMARVSGGVFVATMHRVRAPGVAGGRISVPFFFEPGERCVVRGLGGEDGVVYGDHVRGKMVGWVEFA